eukprot:5836221-Prymnesium_polylepis.1
MLARTARTARGCRSAPPHCRARHDCQALIQRMLALGADPEAVDDLGRGSLMHAAIADAAECIRLLL